MFILASIFLNSTLKTINGQIIGRISFVAVDPSQGKIVGLVFTKGFFQKQAFVVMPKDVISAGDGQTTINDSEQVSSISEIIRARDVWHTKINFFGITAQTESGQFLGYVKDMLVDRESFFIHRFYIQDGKLERILARDLALGLNHKKLIFKDEALSKPALNVQPSPKLAPVPALS